MADQTTLEPWLRDILVKQSCREPGEVTPAARLVEDLGLDSLDQIEIQMAIETARRVTMEDGVIFDAVTVADLIALVDRTIRAGEVPHG